MSTYIYFFTSLNRLQMMMTLFIEKFYHIEKQDSGGGAAPRAPKHFGRKLK